ncbi:MAG: ATP-binding protein [Candidatus Limnocylindrales bacterium]
MSIRSRLAAWHGVGVVVTIVAVGVVVWWQMGLALQAGLDTTLRTRAAGALNSLENVGQAGIQETDHSGRGVFVVLFGPDGSRLDASVDAPAAIPAISGQVETGGRRYLLVAQTAADGSRVVTGADLQPLLDSQASLARLLAVVGLGVGAVSLLGGWLLAGRALRPVDELIEAAALLGPGDLDRRLDQPARMDEVGRLTLTLNAMLERIADSVERQRLFVAIGHELRTPLAALRAELDIVARRDATLAEYRSAVRSARGDAIRLTSLATSLLDLAESRDEERSLSRGPVRLLDIVTSVVTGAEPLMRQTDFTVEVNVPDEVVWVDGQRLEHALGNLVANAVTHGASGGDVEVRGQIRSEPDGRRLRLEVLDRGPGLGPDRPAELFVPFQRGARAVGTGSGLGLATVAGAVRAHGGRFGAENRSGGGALFWFEVPCDSVEPAVVVDPVRPSTALASSKA